ncbi:GTP-binding protein [Nesterenkonia alba]|uniref:GTP-binding protein n=1 Tax=Nesterenkonia alba TaxID=515814 RepID=UPI0003B74840|nr:GTP-binding protein [Nesterenkonia alba]
MEPAPLDVIAVVGACGPERRDYARRLARHEGRKLLSAQRIAVQSDALRAITHRLERAPYGPELLVELPLHAHMPDVIGELTDGPHNTRLSDIVCVVDAPHLVSDLFCEEYIVTDQQRLWDLQEERTEFIARAELIVQQIEYSSTVVILNWQSLPGDYVQMLTALISHLNPQAALHLGDTGDLAPTAAAPPYTPDQTRPGWISLLNQNFSPAVEHPAVMAMRYDQPRLFHPARLRHLLDGEIDHGAFGKLVRSSGFCRLATRPHITAHWEQVGGVISLLPLSFDHQITEPSQMLTMGQDIALIGIELDLHGLTAALDAALLTDEEFAAGPMLWATFEDPFPAWTPH